MSAARSVSRVKPIIVLKSGRSPAGAKAAASHTGANPIDIVPKNIEKYSRNWQHFDIFVLNLKI